MSERIFDPCECKLKDGEGLYVFCFTPAGRIAGVKFPLLEEEIHTCQDHSGELAALFIKVDTDDWTDARGEENLKNLEWVGRGALRHQKVLESLMDYTPVLPVRFGTIFSSIENIRNFIDRHFETFFQFLIYIENKREWGVKGYIDRQKAEETFLLTPSSPLSISSPGAQYLQKNLLRNKAKKQIGEWLKQKDSAIAESLGHEALEGCRLKKLCSEITGKKMEMVFNWAFLLQENRCQVFFESIEKINTENSSQGLVLEVSGPWPPYNFCPQVENFKKL